MDYASTTRALAFSPSVFWVVFGLTLLVWAGMSAVLVYHWNTYGTGDPKIRRMKRVYFIGSSLLFLSALSFIFSL
jgi:hypothetical protein